MEKHNKAVIAPIGVVKPLRENGEYPVKQIIFVNMDSILAPIFNQMIRGKYGEMDIIHQMSLDFKSDKNGYTDLDKLMMTSKGVISTCWTIKRTMNVLQPYILKRGWSELELPVRVYNIAWLVNDNRFERP